MAKASAFGMPRVPRLVRAAALAALAGAMLAAAPAAAQTLCAGLGRAMAAAAADFAPLVIAGERGRAGAAPARTLLPWAQRCEVRGTPAIVEYRCRMTALDAAPAAARAAYRRSVAEMRRCFAGLVPRGEGDYAGAKEWMGAVIWEPRPGLRAAAIFFAQEEFALVAGREEDEADRVSASWIVVDKRRR